MLVILITVITQGPRVPADMRGPLRGSLLINSGVFQAIGVISFGKSHDWPVRDRNTANKTLQLSFAVSSLLIELSAPAESWLTSSQTTTVS